MKVEEAIKTRRSVRSYKPDPVPEEKLKKVLEAARLAPSAHNAQEWRFVVARDEKRRKELARAAGQSFVGEAPVIIAAVSLNPEHILNSGVRACSVDLPIAVDHMALRATEEGLGTCWIGSFSQGKVKKILDIPREYKVVVLLLLGFPADSPGPKTRETIEEIVCYERFRK